MENNLIWLALIDLEWIEMEKQLGLTNKHESIQLATYRTYGISLQSKHVVYFERHSYLAGTNRPLGNQNMEPGWYTHELCHHLPTNDATNRGLPMWRCSSSSKGTYSHYYCISWNWRLSLCCTTYLNPELHHQAPDHTDSCWKTPQKKKNNLANCLSFNHVHLLKMWYH